LLSAIPVPRAGARRDRTILTGDVPSPIAPPPGCHLHQRCPHAIERCRIERPALIESGGHATACHRWAELPQVKAVPSDGGYSPVLDRLIGAFAQPMGVQALGGVDTVMHGAGAAPARS
jgi:peptide/nickel transport system ATP-binding protein/oligopeptide transport system ATP-binding protein